MEPTRKIESPDLCATRRTFFSPVYRYVPETGQIFWHPMELSDRSRSVLRQKDMAWLNNTAPRSAKKK